jgi:hypothetical protein
MNAFPLPSFGRESGLVAALLGALLLLAVAFTGTVYSTLATAAGTPATGASTPVALPLASQAPVVMGDTRWGFGSNTYCETYVEWRTGIGNQGPTAFAAYLHLASQGLVHAGPAPVGALVYFGPSGDNEFDGHVGIADGAGLFTSVTAFGVQQEPLAGWAAPYLGWVDPAAVRAARG